MKYKNLNSIRLKFSTNRSVGGLKEEATKFVKNITLNVNSSVGFKRECFAH